jgi:hypothetical protein
MDFPITNIDLEKICTHTNMTYKAMVYKLLQYVAANLEDGFIYESERVVEGCLFIDVIDGGVKKTYNVFQFVYVTLPYKFYLKLKWMGIAFPPIDRITEFENYMWLLYKQADTLTKHFTIKLISNPNK